MRNKFIINVGSKNKAKVEAVEEILKEYPHLADAEVVGLDVSAGVPDQPRSMEETITGAMNRAKNAFKNCTYSIGLESGLMEVPRSKTGYMDICACVIYDGTEFHFGLSSAWEFPQKEIVDLIMKEEMDMSQAINHFGLTKNKNIGAEEGAIGILTKGRLNRKEYTKQALRTALIHIENFE